MKRPPPLLAGRLTAVLTMLLPCSPASLEAVVPAVAVGGQHSLFLTAGGSIQGRVHTLQSLPLQCKGCGAPLGAALLFSSTPHIR
ncbi:MAG: hypothetical protein JWM59_3645 [Verrucomicrobiales bacterium]|nr:hypothetical protein [Verrucomicrobiales bacterium]